MTLPRSLLVALAVNQHDPEAYYNHIKTLSDEADAFFDQLLGSYVITGSQSALNLLKSQALSKAPNRTRSNDVRTAREVLESQFIYRADEDAVDAKRLWSSLLNQRASDCSYEVTKHAENAISRLQKNGSEIYEGVLRLYVSDCMYALLGIDTTFRPFIQEHVQSYVAYLDGKILSPGDEFDALSSLEFLVEFFGREFKSDYFSLSHRSQSSFLANLVLVLAAGHESAAFALGTLFVETQKAFGAAWPPQWSSSDKALIREALRFDSPVQLIGRLANRDIELERVSIGAGEHVLVHVGMANRFMHSSASEIHFDPERSAVNLLSFGVGMGSCPGSGFANAMLLSFLDKLREMKISFSIDLPSVRYSSGIAGREFSKIIVA